MQWQSISCVECTRRRSQDDVQAGLPNGALDALDLPRTPAARTTSVGTTRATTRAMAPATARTTARATIQTSTRTARRNESNWAALPPPRHGRDAPSGRLPPTPRGYARHHTCVSVPVSASTPPVERRAGDRRLLADGDTPPANGHTPSVDDHTPPADAAESAEAATGQAPAEPTHNQAGPAGRLVGRRRRGAPPQEHQLVAADGRSRLGRLERLGRRVRRDRASGRGGGAYRTLGRRAAQQRRRQPDAAAAGLAGPHAGDAARELRLARTAG